jgi:hypothetical protein
VPTVKANDQYPEIAMPSRSRPTSRTAKLGATATARFDSVAAASRARSTLRRSARGSSTAMVGAVMAPAIAVAATARPAVPSLTPMSAARPGRTLAGRNSLATSIAIPEVSAISGVQVLPGRAPGMVLGVVPGGEGCAGAVVLWVAMPPPWPRPPRPS